jgi:hypothetical protein
MAWETLAIQGVSALLSGLGGQAEADAQNAAIERQHKYNMQSWRYGKKSTKSDYRHSVKQWRLNEQNEETLAAFKDATNLQDWQYNLKIQDFEYASQMKQYAKSEQIFKQQLTFNKMAQAAANEAEYRKLEDTTKELAFLNQDIVIKALQSEGAAAVRGQQGRSAEKLEQAQFAALGRNQAILAESLLSAKADTGAALRKIANDKFGADLAAEANRMLRPDRLPQPPKPLTTPRAEYLKPRRPKKFDIGPMPIKGAMASSAGSWMGAATQGLSSIAGAIGSGSKYNFSLGGASNQSNLGSLGSSNFARNMSLDFGF